MHAGAWSFAVVSALLAAVPLDGMAMDGRDGPRSPYVLAGGGVTRFSGRELRSSTSPGGTWDLRLGLDTRSAVGGEFACVGSFIPSRHSGSKLVLVGAEAVVRLQYPHASSRWLVEPFVLAGLGWAEATLTDGDQGVRASDRIGDVPLGAGLTLGRGRLLLDARFTYRATFHEQLRAGASDRKVQLDRWSLTTYVGCAL